MKVVLAVYGASLCASLLATLLGAYPAARVCGAPALVMSAWAVFGHFITLDDDAPGGWSNPDDSSEVWRASLGELAVKAGAFALALLLVAYLPAARGGA